MNATLAAIGGCAGGAMQSGTATQRAMKFKSRSNARCVAVGPSAGIDEVLKGSVEVKSIPQGAICKLADGDSVRQGASTFCFLAGRELAARAL